MSKTVFITIELDDQKDVQFNGAEVIHKLDVFNNKKDALNYVNKRKKDIFWSIYLLEKEITIHI